MSIKWTGGFSSTWTRSKLNRKAGIERVLINMQVTQMKVTKLYKPLVYTD